MEGFFMLVNKYTMKKNKSNLSDSWEEISNRLMRTYYFTDYDEVMSFVNKVMNVAKKMNHHPDMTVHYDNVKLSIMDHEKGIVTNKCHQFALSVDKIK